jgi:hypothetical protein
MSDPIEHPPVHHDPEALIEGNRVATAGDMESTEEKPGYKGEAPNPPLADWGPRGDAPAPEEEEQL